MYAVQTNSYISQQITSRSFRAAVQRLRDSTLLKIGEGNVESTIANNLPQVRSEISAIVNAHEDAFPVIANLWRTATPIPDLVANPHPGELAPNAQQQRDIDLWEKVNERERIEREMHRLLVDDALYNLARPTYHHRMEIDQPAVQWAASWSGASTAKTWRRRGISSAALSAIQEAPTSTSWKIG